MRFIYPARTSDLHALRLPRTYPPPHTHAPPLKQPLLRARNTTLQSSLAPARAPQPSLHHRRFCRPAQAMLCAETSHTTPFSALHEPPGGENAWIERGAVSSTHPPPSSSQAERVRDSRQLLVLVFEFPAAACNEVRLSFVIEDLICGGRGSAGARHMGARTLSCQKLTDLYHTAWMST